MSEYINTLYAESIQPKSEGDAKEKFEYADTKNVPMSKAKEDTVGKHAQRIFRQKHGFNFEKIKSPDLEEEYNKIFEESAEHYKHIA